MFTSSISECRSGTWGYNCAQQCTCNDNQECNPTTGCVCTSGVGWTGVDCDEDIDECLYEPCVYGTCTDLINNFR